MKNFGLGIVVTIVALVALLKFGTSVDAQESRLQKHGELKYNGSQGTLYAICDTGNGTLIYVAGSNYSWDDGKALGLQLNGCAKAK